MKQFSKARHGLETNRNERMCYLRIQGCFYNYSIICVYAPHMEGPDQEKDQFYDQLDKLVGSCPKYDAIMILETSTQR